MLKVCKNNREEIEKEFVALVLNKPAVIDLIQIKPKLLRFKKNRDIFEYAIECYKEFGLIDINQIALKHPGLDIEYYVELFTETIWHKTAWREQLKISQESILKFYKEDIAKECGEKLKRKEISFEQYMAYIKKLDELVLTNELNLLTKTEIEENITVSKARINLNKFPKLNNTLKLVQGDFLIIGATTGAGKSGLLLNLMNDLMNTYQCIYFNLEMSKSTIYKRIVSIKADLKVDDVENPRTEHQRELISKALDNIEKSETIVEHKAIDIESIRAVVAKCKNDNKHTVVFIDHIGLVKIPGVKNLYEQATEVAKALRQLCLDYDCTIICASQLNRGAYANNEQITLSMLKDSGELENSASKVILLYHSKQSKREDLEPEMILDVAKNRDGFTGTISALYNKEKQIFNEKN